MTNKKWKMRQIFVAFSEYRNFSIGFDYFFENQKNKGWNWDCTFCMWLFREIWYSPRLEYLLLQVYRAHNKTMRIYVFRNNFGYHVPPKKKKWKISKMLKVGFIHKISRFFLSFSILSLQVQIFWKSLFHLRFDGAD